MKRTALLLSALSVLSAACDDGSSGDDGDGVPTPDAGPPPPAWEKGLPAASVMGERRGLTPARGIIHLHSPYSHDACDGDPRPGGVPDETCVQHLRDALCITRMDYAALTDHDDSMADEPWGGALFLERAGDELVENGLGKPVANRLDCGALHDGHQVLLTVGGENDLMPLMLDDHPAGTVMEVHDWYNANTPAAVADFRAHGGLAWVAHGESKPADLLRPLALDGMEVYSLHANIDPDIREEFLGLDGFEAVNDVIQFADMTDQAPEPDLAILSFLSENGPAIETWQTLLAEGFELSGSAGTDAHENALPIMLKDGERGDSYRRMIRWFANVALVADPTDPAQIEAAIGAGRFFMAFEVFGTPVGFDARAEVDGGAVVELGGTALVADGVDLVATVPSIHELDPMLPVPQIELRLLRVEVGGGSTVVASAQSGELRHRVDTAAVYRFEVRIVPRHLAPYMGRLVSEGYTDVEFVWIYSNPFYLR